MSDMKQFVTATREYREGAEARMTITFQHDDREVTAKKFKDGQLSLLMASQGGYSEETDRIAGMIDFFISLFPDKEDGRYFAHRLNDGDDGFDLEDLEDITYWLIEQFTERPTKPSSASISPQPPSGDVLTESSASEASTSSTSGLEKPAISSTPGS